MNRRKWIGLAVMAALGMVVDTLQRPSRQVSTFLCESALGGYRVVKDRLGIRPRCRFVPSCSHYSSEAFARFGFWRGSILTCSRLCRCRPSVPMHTRDPVPLA
jgi:putative component of membrane protein insertase Oxa1/YidC/SpoIIIJ protein YidD